MRKGDAAGVAQVVLAILAVFGIFNRFDVALVEQTEGSACPPIVDKNFDLVFVNYGNTKADFCLTVNSTLEFKNNVKCMSLIPDSDREVGAHFEIDVNSIPQRDNNISIISTYNYTDFFFLKRKQSFSCDYKKELGTTAMNLIHS